MQWRHMASNSCKTGGLGNLLSTLQGASNSSRSQAQSIANITREARSLIVADNILQPRFATATPTSLGTGKPGPIFDPSNPNGGNNGGGNNGGGTDNGGGTGGNNGGGNSGTGGNVGSHIAEYGTVGTALSSRGAYILGLQNRLYLKYLGVDFESYNHHDLKYRSA